MGARGGSSGTYEGDPGRTVADATSTTTPTPTPTHQSGTLARYEGDRSGVAADVGGRGRTPTDEGGRIEPDHGGIPVAGPGDGPTCTRHGDALAAATAGPHAGQDVVDQDSAEATPRLGASESVARQVVDLVTDRLAQGGGLRVLGITGPPGTGKSTVAGMVADLLEARGVAVAGLAPMDGFHLSNTVLEDAGLADRKGAPDTFDVWGYVALLQRVQRGEQTVFAPGYRRDLHEPVAASSVVRPRGVVITEGNYLGLDAAGWREARDLIDVLVHVETPETELLRRLIARQEAFGRDRVDAAHWVRTVDAANITLVAGDRDRADAVIRPRPPEARPV